MPAFTVERPVELPVERPAELFVEVAGGIGGYGHDAHPTRDIVADVIRSSFAILKKFIPFRIRVTLVHIRVYE